jgi:hypothetical protein
VTPLKELLTEIDARWKPLGVEPVTLQIIGSAALMLQTAYDRGTKDGDVLESRDGPAAVDEQLRVLAGRGTDMHAQFHVYIDVVRRALLFLPQQPLFHPLPDLTLKNFKVAVLDVNDVLLSKLPRYSRDDANDIRAMADLGFLDHKRLAARFEAAVDRFTLDARAPDIPRYLKNLHIVERDILVIQPSRIELPPECLSD